MLIKIVIVNKFNWFKINLGDVRKCFYDVENCILDY